MKAILMRRFGDRSVLEYAQVVAPEPGPKEVRVVVKATALNHLDVWIRKGIGNPKVSMPHVFGSEVAGVIEATGPGVSPDLQAGTEVLINPGISCGRCVRCLAGADNLCPEYQILGEHRWGGCAEFVVVPEQNVVLKPNSLSFAEAAAVPLTFLTAWQMVVQKLKVRQGDDVLVMAAGSGLSTAAIQIAKLHGARIIATASSPGKLEHAESLGADNTVLYDEAGWHREVRRMTGGKGADKVVDHTGAAYWESVIKATADGGIIAVAGASSGYHANTPLAHIFYRQITIHGSTMGSKSILIDVLRFFETGQLRPVIYATLPLSKAAEGHRLLEDREVIGKVVLEVE